MSYRRLLPALFTLILAATPGWAAADLTLKRVLLSTGGVGYFEYEALVDGEGPADRWSLVPPAGNELSSRDPWDDVAWDGIEARTLLPSLAVPYARLQAERDHLHGTMTHHARRMDEAAAAAGLLSRPLRVVEGDLRDHPLELVDALQWSLRQVRGW